MKRFLVLFTILVAVIAVWLTLNPQWITLQGVDIELAQDSSEQLLFQRIRSSLQPRLEALKGKVFWEVPLKQIQELTLKDKRVRKVNVYREFPMHLRLEIEPHTPVLAYLGGDSRVYPVATDATLLPAINLSEVSNMPLLRGEELKDEQHLREAAVELLDNIPPQGSLSRQNVSEIIYSHKDGFKVFLTNARTEVKMGDSDFGPKVSRVEKVLSYLESQNVKGRVIDARYAKKVVVRVRKGP